MRCPQSFKKKNNQSLHPENTLPLQQHTWTVTKNGPFCSVFVMQDSFLGVKEAANLLDLSLHSTFPEKEVEENITN